MLFSNLQASDTHQKDLTKSSKSFLVSVICTWGKTLVQLKIKTLDFVLLVKHIQETKLKEAPNKNENLILTSSQYTFLSEVQEVTTKYPMYFPWLKLYYQKDN